MAVTYNKLWHLLIDRGMKKKDLKEAAGLTSHAMMKLRNNEDITTQTITATKNDVVIILQINNSTMKNNGVDEVLDVAPVIVGSSTFVPIRAVSQSLKADVE